LILRNKREIEGYVGLKLPHNLSSLIHTMLNKTQSACIVLMVSLNATMESNGCDVRNSSDERTICLLIRRKFLYVSFFYNKHNFKTRSQNCENRLLASSYLRTAPFWVITQRVVLISYRRIETAYWSQHDMWDQ